MEELLVATMLALCKLYTPDQMGRGCPDVADFMVNCVIESDIKAEKIKQCEKQFAGGSRYEETKRNH